VNFYIGFSEEIKISGDSLIAGATFNPAPALIPKLFLISTIHHHPPHASATRKATEFRGDSVSFSFSGRRSASQAAEKHILRRPICNLPYSLSS
jgi:hypothetical protein